MDKEGGMGDPTNMDKEETPAARGYGAPAARGYGPLQHEVTGPCCTRLRGPLLHEVNGPCCTRLWYPCTRLWYPARGCGRGFTRRGGGTGTGSPRMDRE